MNFNLFKAFKEKFGVKVFTVFTVFIFAVAFSFTAFFVHYESKALSDTLIRNGKLLARFLAQNARLAVFSEHEALLKDLGSGILEQEGVLGISIFNQEGKLLKRQARSGAPPQAGSFSASFEEEEERASREIFKTLEDPLVSVHVERNGRLEFWSPVVSGSGPSGEEALFLENLPAKKDRVIGFVKITIDKGILDKQLHALLLRSILIGVLFVMMGSGITYLLVRGVTRPLNRLTEGVKTVGSGGVAEKIPVETTDEIGKLAQAFNHMSESLERRNAEKQRLEDQLRQAIKMEAIGTLAGGIAHDFNNILGAILGYTELALVEASGGTTLHHDLKEILKAGKRAKDLVKQILTFSRHGEQERKPVQVSLTVKEALKMLRASLPTTIEIRQNIPTGLSTVLSDPTQIHQVVMNLCANAAHAMESKVGVLEVSLVEIEVEAETAVRHLDMTPGRYQKLTVRDTGHGMSREIMDRIFDPFFTTKEAGVGTGMGLAVVHGIVKSHGGAITVRSEPGKGSAFEVFFPSLDSDAETEFEQLSLPPRGSERILFVDDEEALVRVGRQMLESLGYKVAGRTSSIEALGALRAKPDQFDLVITDMTMPNMTGADLAKEILRIRSDVPIILCTGFSEAISEKRAKALGIREFVMKPIALQDIAQVIRRVLDQGKEQEI